VPRSKTEIASVLPESERKVMAARRQCLLTFCDAGGRSQRGHSARSFSSSTQPGYVLLIRDRTARG
jgi:hypothetical protein